MPCLLLVTLLFHAPRFGNIDTSVIISFILGCIYISKRIKLKIKPNLFEYFFFYISIYALLLFALEGFTNYPNNGHYFFRVTRSCFIYLSFFFLSDTLNIKIKDIINAVAFALFLNLLVVYLQYFSIGTTQDFFLQLNTLFPPGTNPLEDMVNVKGGVRVRGLMKGFDSAGVMIALLGHWALFYNKNNLIKISLSSLCLMGVLITSRVGLVALITIFLLYIASNLLFNDIKKTLIQLMISVIFLGTSIYVIKTKLNDTVFYKKSFSRALEVYDSLLSKGEVVSVSFADTLNNHFTLRNITSTKILMVGKASKQQAISSNSPKALNKLTSDVGYIQLLYNFGIPNMVLIVFIHLLLTYSLLKNKVKNSLPIIVSIITILITCIKGPYFFSRGIYDIVILGFFINSYSSRDLTLSKPSQQST